jgi:uncharacterized protein (TIGR03067 family)
MSDQAKLQGRWRITELEVAGNSVPAAAFAGAEVRLADDVFESRGMGAVYRGRISFGSDGDRKTFQLAFFEGPEKGNVNHALYELDGDSWRICLDMKGGPAPASMESSATNGYALETLTRIR